MGIPKRVELLQVDVLSSSFFKEFAKCCLFQCLLGQDEATRQRIESFKRDNASLDQKHVQRLLVNHEDNDNVASSIRPYFPRKVSLKCFVQSSRVQLIQPSSLLYSPTENLLFDEFRCFSRFRCGKPFNKFVERYSLKFAEDPAARVP